MEIMLANSKWDLFQQRWDLALGQWVDQGMLILPRLLLALLLVLAGVLVGRLMARLVHRIAERVGVDQFFGRLGGIEGLSRTPIRWRSGKIIGRMVYYLIFFLFLLTAIDLLQIKALSEIMSQVFAWLPRLISAVVVFLFGILFADMLRGFVRTACHSLDIPAAGLISNLVFYFIFVNIALISLEQSGIETGFIQTNLAIILGGIMLAFALGYGTASRPMLANILSGYYHRNKIRIGDTIRMDGTEGVVVAIDAGSFTVKTDDQTWVTIPLHKLSTEKYSLIKPAINQNEEG